MSTVDDAQQPASPPTPTPGVVNTPSLLQKCVAEAVGTGFIVGGGCGAVCSAMYLGPAYALGA